MAARKKRRLGMGLSGMISTPVEVNPKPSDLQTTPPNGDSEETAAVGAPASSDSGDPARDTAAKGPSAKRRRKNVARPPKVKTAASQAKTGTNSSSEPRETSASKPRRQAPKTPATEVMHLDIADISPNVRQPRQHIDEAALEPLVASIRTAGVMQPVIVRHRGDWYELVAGERRWRAAQMAGLETVPALVRNIDDRTAAEWAIIENVQREDLDPVDKAEAYQRLQDEFGMTHAEIAEQVGLTRAGVTNQIRLCDLDEGTRTLIRHGALTGGHGRSLLGIPTADERLEMAKLAVAGEWSVRELERRVRAAMAPGTSTSTKTAAPSASRAHLDDLEQQLGSHLGTRVQIHTTRTKGAGRIVIEFYDHDQFDGLLGHMGFKPSG